MSDLSCDDTSASPRPPVAGHFGEKSKVRMASARGKWICRDCGRRNRTPAAPGLAVKCEFCAGVPDVQPVRSSGELAGDRRRRGIVARLRERYGAARHLVSSEQPYTEDYSHLDWILGTSRNLDRDETALDTGVSELVVLWLQDLALELDSPVPPRPASDSGRSASPDAESRETIVQGLRSATRDFAEAFLNPRLDWGQP